jgi:biotin carboxyl carrier protein
MSLEEKIEEYKASLAGRVYEVRIKKVGKKAWIEIGSKSYEVEFPKGMAYSKAFPLIIDGKRYEIKIEREGGRYRVEVEGKPWEVRIQKGIDIPRLEIPKLVPKLPSPPKEKVEGAVLAPMPGRVVDLKVRVGDRVRVGQPLLILEAMKLENEIASTREGIVREIRVKRGKGVKKDEILLVIK